MAFKTVDKSGWRRGRIARGKRVPRVNVQIVQTVKKL